MKEIESEEDGKLGAKVSQGYADAIPFAAAIAHTYRPKLTRKFSRDTQSKKYTSHSSFNYKRFFF